MLGIEILAFLMEYKAPIVLGLIALITLLIYSFSFLTALVVGVFIGLLAFIIQRSMS